MQYRAGVRSTTSTVAVSLTCIDFMTSVTLGVVKIHFQGPQKYICDMLENGVEFTSALYLTQHRPCGGGGLWAAACALGWQALVQNECLSVDPDYLCWRQEITVSLLSRSHPRAAQGHPEDRMQSGRVQKKQVWHRRFAAVGHDS